MTQEDIDASKAPLLDHLIDDSGRLRLEGDDPIIVALLAGQTPTRALVSAVQGDRQP